jgi:hypothetical protein
MQVSEWFHAQAVLLLGKRPGYSLDTIMDGPRACLHAVGKVSCPCREFNSGSSTVQPVARHYKIKLKYMIMNVLNAGEFRSL